MGKVDWTTERVDPDSQITVAEAFRLTNVCRPTIQNWVQTGELRSCKIQLMIPRLMLSMKGSDLIAVIEAHQMILPKYKQAEATELAKENESLRAELEEERRKRILAEEPTP